MAMLNASVIGIVVFIVAVRHFMIAILTLHTRHAVMEGERPYAVSCVNGG